MTYWREASTLILALRTAGNSRKLVSGLSRVVDYKVLMLQRSAGSSFMPSKLVFPGGMCHESDFSKDWLGVFKKVIGRPLSDFHASSRASHYPRILPGHWALAPDVAYRICAIRETFEESGLLLATNRQPTDEPFVVSTSASELTRAEEHRQMVEERPEFFLQMCQDLGVVPNIWALRDWRNWLTPVFQKVSRPPAKPKRFNTMFYVCCIDCEGMPQTAACESETTRAEWKSPGTFLEDDLNRDVARPPLAPPQVYEMTSLRSFDSVDDILAECTRRYEAGIQCWMPVFRICRDAALVLLPGDYMYPIEPDYEGTRGLAPPLDESRVAELNDSTRSMNRVVFSGSEMLQNLSQVNTTASDTFNVDSVLQKGTVICNI